jgi:hypothetical protein
VKKEENVWRDLFPAAVAIALFIMIFGIIKVTVENRTRQKAIEKGMGDENLRFLFARLPSEQRLSSLKWGLVLVGLGLALLLRELFPNLISDNAGVGLMFLFSGIAFLVYSFLAEKYLEQIEGEQREL